MLIVSDLNYLITQKVPIEIFSEEEKAIIYYDDKDTVPARALAWLNKISNKMCLFSYSDIGGKDNISFAVGGYVLGSKSASAVIVGSYETEKRILKVGEKEYEIYTTSDFQKIANLSKDDVKQHISSKSNINNGIRGHIGRMIQIIPDESVPSGMDIESFAQVLDSAIARSRGNKNDVIKYLEENLGRNISDNMHILFTTGVYDSISDLILKGAR